MTNLEKKWWFVGALSFMTALAAIGLLTSAGVWPITGVAQAIVSFFCFLGIYRFLSALGRVIVLFASPSSRLLDKRS